MQAKPFHPIIFLCILSVCGSAVFGVIYVDGSVGSSGSGTSWASPYKTIQEAIDAASPFWQLCLAPQQIWVKQGTYTLASEIEVDKVVTLYGGFPAGGSPVLADRDPDAYPTIIDGNNSVRCMMVTAYSVIDGFRFQDGYTTLNAGAIYLDEVPTYDCPLGLFLQVTIRNCQFNYNFAGTHGGAIYDLRSDAKIQNCIFYYNEADAGGAIKQWETSTVIEQCVFSNNTATATGGFAGGAILGDYYVYGSITNCLFYSNLSASTGGAIAYHIGYPTITNCTFTDNISDGDPDSGGAIYCNTAAPTVKNCIFWGDSADEVVSFFHVDGPYISYTNIQGGWGGLGSNNTNVSPGFVGGNDFHLASGSNCIDSGTNTGAPSDDLDDNPRPVDGDNNGTATTDKGCYEYQPPEIDLVIDSMTLNPASPQVGDEVTVTVNIRNQGNTAAGSFWVDFYPDRATPPELGDYGPVFESVPSLGAGATESVVMAYTYTTAGTMSAYAMIDSTGLISEVDETNNVFGPQTVEVSDVDLKITSISYDPRHPQIGETVTVTVTFTNQGTTDVAATFYVDWYADETSPPVAGDYGDRADQFTSLAAGASDTMVTTYTYTTEGTYKTYAQIDSDQWINETNETNNVYGYRSIHAYDGELIDFNIAEDTGSDEHWCGGDDGTVRNVGIGQDITLDHDAWVQYAGFEFSEGFDYHYNPEGVGHAVQLRLHVRDAGGTIIRTSSYFPQASFNGGWIKFFMGTDFWMEAGETYIFTCYVYDGEDTELNSWVYADSTGSVWPTSQGYRAIVYGTPADMTTWANWSTHTWDYNFAMIGQYVDKYPGDVNDDRDVDTGDIAALGLAWLNNDCVLDTWCDNCDINWDKDVQYLDYSVISRYWGNRYDDYEGLNRAAIAKRIDDMSGDNIDGSDGNEFTPGTYFIYRTSAGRYGKFMVTNFDHADSNKLTIDWTTYNANGTIYSTGTDLVIRGTYHCDLDLGLETSTNSDFGWVQVTSSTRYLDPNNGALFDLIYRAP